MRPSKILQKGVASAELAIILPFLIIILLGGIDLARTVYQYNTLVINLRDATKYVSSNVRPVDYNMIKTPPDPEVTKYQNTIKAEAPNLAVCGMITTCVSPSVKGLKVDNIKVSYPDSIVKDGVTFTFVKVSIDNFSLGFVTNLFGDSLALSDISLTMYQLQQN